MSTNSTIRLNDKIIYCHWNGYIEYNGFILVNHYTDVEKIEELLSLGNISILAENVSGDSSHCFENPNEGIVVAYHRDRGEEWEDGTNYGQQSFNYTFVDGEWYVNSRSENINVTVKSLLKDFKGHGVE